jgi:hypothetical protein
MPCEEGLSIYVKKFISIHETPCFHYCVDEHEQQRATYLISSNKGNPVSILKEKRLKVYRVAKSGSRIAFDDEQKAYENLLLLKRKQLGHLQRDIEFINTLINYGSNKLFEDIPTIGSFKTVPNTHELVHEHYSFD